VLQPNEDLIVRARGIRALVLDVDGVLTDATLIYGARGESLKRFSARDGFAIKTAMQERLSIAILSGRLAPPIKARVTDLGIASDHVIQGSRNKRTDITALAGRLGIPLHEVAFMGDDLPDLPALTLVGLAASPADAAAEVRERCHFVASLPGGRGAVRELIELILKSRGRWEAIVEAWTAGGPPEGFYSAGEKGGGQGNRV
jgi:3-deoxy-D-manno-octulosonate 8-phosphate phosphatase (KDO 8-P phosphatase)